MQLCRSVALAACLVGLGCGSSEPELAGEWQRVDVTTGKVLEKLSIKADTTYVRDTFRADGTLDARFSGTFVRTGTNVVTTQKDETHPSEPTIRVTTSIYLSQSRLISAALFPQGSHQGIQGTWNTSVSVERLSETGTVTDQTQFLQAMEFKADNTVRSTVTAPDTTPSVQSGTYALKTGTSYQITYTMPQVAPDEVTLVDDQALGRVIYQR